MDYILEQDFSMEDFYIKDKLDSGKTNPSTDNVLGLENHCISDTYFDWESVLNLTHSDPVNSAGEVSTPSLLGDRQPDQLQGHGSPGSTMSTTDDDSPFSPLSEGAETMTWSPEQQAAAEALQFHQRESDPGASSSVAVIKPRMGMTKSPVTTEGQSQLSSSSQPVPAPVIQILEAVPQSSTGGRGGTTTQQVQSLANHLPVRQDCSNIVELNELNKSQRGVKRKAQVSHGEEEEESHSPGSCKMSRNEKNAIAARENRQKKKRELEDLKSTNAAQEKEIISLRKTNSEQSKEIMSLREELDYYKRVLSNDSALSALLRSMNPTPTIKLDSVFGDRDKNSDNTKTGSSGGICLHVCGNSPHASLQFCPTCASKAHTTFNS